MTRIISIIFPGLCGVLCPTGMLCLSGIQPRFEQLPELQDVKEDFAWSYSWYCLLLDATQGNGTTGAKPHCTTGHQQDKPHEPQFSNPLHARSTSVATFAPRNHCSRECFSCLLTLVSSPVLKIIHWPSILLLATCCPTQLQGWVLLLWLHCTWIRARAALQKSSSRIFPCSSPHHLPA